MASFVPLAILFCVVGWCDGVGYKGRLADAVGASDIVSPIADEQERLRGGVHQRAHADVASRPSVGDSNSVGSEQRLPLNNRLRLDWAKGLISSSQVQAYAFAAQQQGASGVDRLAHIGNSGNNPQNLFRALVNLFGHPKGAPRFDWYEIPTKRGPRTAHPFLLPHTFFQAYFAEQRSGWCENLRGPKRGIAEFWRSIEDSAFFTNHPNHATQNWAKTVPLGMHGDGGAFSNQDSLYTISFNSLLGVGTTIRKRFVMTTVRKNEMLPGTLDAIQKILCWSFNVLLSGREPDTSYLGVPSARAPTSLADDWCGCLCQVRGDWAFYAEILYVPKWNEAVSMCWLCRASNTLPALLWTDCRRGAGWRATMWTHESYTQHLRDNLKPMPVILQCVIGFRIECIMIDVMHAVDLGIAAHIVASVLWYFVVVRACLGAGRMVQKVALLAAHVKKWYSSTRCAYQMQGPLTLERLRATSSSWPKLRCKAAATRKLSAYALEIAMAFANDSDLEQSILEIVRLLVRFYQIIDSESMFLSDAVREELPRLGQVLCEQYCKVASYFFDHGSRLFKMSPKLHLFQHLCEFQCLIFGNPRYYWCYADEDLVGQMIEIASSCHPATMASMVLFKWLHICFSEL